MSLNWLHEKSNDATTFFWLLPTVKFRSIHCSLSILQIPNCFLAILFILWHKCAKISIVLSFCKPVNEFCLSSSLSTKLLIKHEVKSVWEINQGPVSTVCGFHSVCVLQHSFFFCTIDTESDTEQEALFSGLINWCPLLFLSQKKHSSNPAVENPKLAVRKSTILFVGHKTAWPGEMGDLLKQKISEKFKVLLNQQHSGGLLYLVYLAGELSVFQFLWLTSE